MSKYHETDHESDDDGVYEVQKRKGQGVDASEHFEETTRSA